MTSMPIRDPETDPLLTPSNFATDRTQMNSWEDREPVDTVGGTSRAAHEAGLRRIEQAGARPISWAALLCELQRDRVRGKTAGAVAKVLFTVEGK